jgi:D-glycero-alpha-D-manno-heptose 1-phosphate guanylyltransferase
MITIPTSAILAGGLGTRLQAAVPGSAKSVVPVAGRPFLHRLLGQLASAGCRRVVLCVGYRFEQVVREIGYRFEHCEIVYSCEDHPLGTAGALGLAWHRYGGDRDGWLVTNGDSFCNLDLAEFWSEHQQAGLAATIAAVKVPDGARYGRLVWNMSGQVTRFSEKEQRAEECWINAGIYGLAPEFLNALGATTPLSLEREVFPEWISRGIRVCPREARFIDIGTPESYESAQHFFTGESG